MASLPSRCVLVLGGGIHGVGIARELLLNGVPVVLVDAHDIAAGATAKSSRLIHGGVRYLEYGDFHLVRESLVERRRMLEQARHFVRPLRLYIPVRESWSGLWRSALGFFGWRRTAWGRWLAGPPRRRGYWPVRMGLNLYDRISRDESLPRSAGVSLKATDAPQVDRQRYRRFIAYSDAQLQSAERFVLALLADCQQIARTQWLPFVVHTHAEVSREGESVVIESPWTTVPQRLQPALIVNATGPWGDATLKSLGVAGPPLFGGTKGSHFLTWHRGLIEALRGQAVYAEADDGRLVFILPYGDGVLVGTTDEAYDGDPAEAVASEAELTYLIGLVRGVLGITLERSDLTVHYSGVRPLPRSVGAANAEITRDYSLSWQDAQGLPILTLVGGKLTTWRAFAEEAADQVLQRLGYERRDNTQARTIPGNDPLPTDVHPGPELWNRWAREYASTPEEVAALWPLYGTRIPEVLRQSAGLQEGPIADGPWSARVVHWIIANESVWCLDDLVERRLLAVFRPELTRAMLNDLAQCLVEAGRLTAEQQPVVIEACVERLRRHYGRIITD